LALGAKRKKDISASGYVNLVNGEKSYPLPDMFFGRLITFIFQDSISLFNGPVEGLFENAPKLF
jgi:hypothetical protein